MIESTLIPQVVYRHLTKDDEGFVYNSWLKSYRDNSAFARAIPKQIYFANHKLVIGRLLKDAGVVIAANPDDPGQIFGYAVFQPTTSRVAILHWLYVKSPYRRLGIGGEIFRAIQRASDHDDTLPVIGTHWTELARHLEQKWNLVFNPYMLGTPHESY